MAGIATAARRRAVARASSAALAIVVAGLALVVASALPACDDATSATVPTTITHVALIGPTSVSPLFPATDPHRFALEDLETATLIGYDDAALDPLIPYIDAAEPLARQESTCAALPRPTWAATRADDGFAPVDAPDVPLSAAWLRLGCPTPDQIMVSCGYRVCRGGVVDKTAPCAWRAACDDGTTFAVRPSVWPAGRAGCASNVGAAIEGPALTDEWWSSDRARYHGEVDVAANDRCTIDTLRITATPLDVSPTDVAKLGTAQPRVPPTLETGENPFLDARTMQGGFLTGLVIDAARRRALVASTSAPCPGTARAGRWQVVDLDAPELTSVTGPRMPGCLAGLRRVAASGNFLRMVGFTIDRSTFAISAHEFDETLRRTRAATVATALEDASIADVFIGANRWLVLSTQHGIDPHATLHAIDPETLTVTATLTGLAAAFALEVGAGGRVRVHLRDRPIACEVPADLSSMECAASCPARDITPVGGLVKFSALARAGTLGALVLAASDAAQGLWACDAKLRLQSFEGVSQVSALRAIDGDRVVVASVVPDEAGVWRGRLAIANVHEKRYEPRSWALPGSVVSRFDADDDGRLWALLPWDGLILRWTPPAP